MNLPFSSVKILKPDVPPKRRKAYVQLLRAWFRLRFPRTSHMGAIGDTVAAAQRAAGEQKAPWRRCS